MDERALNKMYISAIRQRRKSGARWQKAKEISTHRDGDNSPYRAFVEDKRGNMEPDLAVGREFPRKFNVPTAIRNAEITHEVTGRVHTLLRLAKQVLTERQYAVFVMVALKDPALTEREVAKVLSISPGRVHQLRVATMDKLRRAYDERT